MNEDRVVALDLKAKREAMGLTQERLAKLLGLSSGNTVYLIESGLRNLSFPVALRCAKLFGSVSVSFNGETFVLTPEGMFPAGDASTYDDSIDAGTAKDELAATAGEVIPQLTGHAMAVRAAQKGKPDMLARLVEGVRDLRQRAATYEHALRKYPFAGQAFAMAEGVRADEAIAA